MNVRDDPAHRRKVSARFKAECIAPPYGIAALLLAIFLLGAVDLYFDFQRNASLPHVVIESVIVVLSLVGGLWLVIGWHRAGAAARSASRSLQAHLAGLGETIGLQFDAWGLTEAEKQTAILLLKGLSHKEIARQCMRGERTVRQHSVSVYRKSGLSGRAELAAYFMEDVLAPLNPKPIAGTAEVKLPGSTTSQGTPTRVSPNR